MSRFGNPREYKNTKEELEDYGFKQNFSVQKMPLILIIIVITLVIILGAGSQFSSYAQQGSRISTVFITLGIFVLGYHQWRAARHEISMDKFYDRLDMVDRRLEN